MSPMRTLLLQLPLCAPGPTAVYGHAWLDSVSPDAKVSCKHSVLALLPRAERGVTVAALVPAAALSWHRVSLPAGLGRSSQRLQAVLAGLLEDRLLQEPSQLHLALPPHWKAGEPTWVAVCDKTWLQTHLQALQEVGLAIQRIVPEFAPPAQGQCWHALGNEGSGWLWCRSAEHGVSGWPLAVAAQLPSEWLREQPVQAEPALAAWVQSHLNASVELVEADSHWRQALAEGWDLAQFDLSSRLRIRGWQRLHRLADVLLRHPQWRAARWGLLALLAVQFVGLNAWAWMTRQQWDVQQAQWTRLLQQSFPKVTVVLDPPAQMEREVARLRQGSGQLTARDFESMLDALGSALPANAAAPVRLAYQDGTLEWPALDLSPEQKSVFEQTLQRQGYRLQMQDAVWRLNVQEASR